MRTPRRQVASVLKFTRGVCAYLGLCFYRYYQEDLVETPEKLPSLESLEPVEEIEKDLIKEMRGIDRIATSPGGRKLIAAAIAEEFHTTSERVLDVARSFSLNAGGTALVLALAEESGGSLESLVVAVEERRSWPEVARDYGVPLARLMRRLRAVERTTRKLAESRY